MKQVTKSAFYCEKVKLWKNTTKLNTAQINRAVTWPFEVSRKGVFINFRNSCFFSWNFDVYRFYCIFLITPSLPQLSDIKQCHFEILISRLRSVFHSWPNQLTSAKTTCLWTKKNRLFILVHVTPDFVKVLLCQFDQGDLLWSNVSGKRAPDFYRKSSRLVEY